MQEAGEEEAGVRGEVNTMIVTDAQVVQFYNSAAWKRTREFKLAHEPLCETCKLSGEVVPAVQVHHSLPIRTHWDERFDQRYLFSLCDACHCAVEDEIRRPGGG